MSIRRKTRNRILLLLGLAVVGTGALGGAYFVRRSYLNASAMRDREAGMAAVKAEDYATGLTDLGHYLNRFSNRPEAEQSRYAEALFNYALSRQMVEEPKGAHLFVAVSLWKRYLALPEAVRVREAEARHKLLDAQSELHWLPEALDTAVEILKAEEILKTEPKDLKSLTIKTQALLIQRNFKDARTAAEAWAEAYPQDIDAHLTLIQITCQLEPEKATSEYFVAYAKKLNDADPKEPHLALLASYAYVQGLDLKDKPAGRAKLALAALALSTSASDLSDAQFVQRLVRQLDILWVQSILFGNQQEVGAAGKGLDLARQSQSAHPADLEYQRLYALELLQVNGSKQVEAFLTRTTPDAAKADGRLLGLKAFAAFSQDNKIDGLALLKATEKLGTKDAGVAALCEALRVVFVTALDDAAAMADLQKTLNDPSATVADCQAKLRAFVQDHPDDTQLFTELKATLDDKAAQRADIRTKLNAYRLSRLKAQQEICKAAAAKSLSDPLVTYLLGEADLRTGDAEGAAEALRQTLSLAPAWVQANLRMGQLAASLRNGEAAVQFADIVHGLAPDDPKMLIFETLVSAAVAVPGQTERIDKALGFLREFQTRFPDKLSSEDKQAIAQHLTRLGMTQEAIKLLASPTPTTTVPGNNTLMLAKLYADQKRYTESQALVDQLLASAPTLDAIMFATDLAAFRPDLNEKEKKDKIDQAMGKLDALKVPSGWRERVWANYYSRHGMPQQAIDSWKAALRADPTSPANPAIWQMLLAFCLKTASTEQFDATASFFTNFAEARKAVPDNPAISHLVSLQETPGRKRDPKTPTLLEEMCRDLFMRSMVVARLETPDGNDERTTQYAKAITASVDALAKSQEDVDKLEEGDAAGVRNIQEKLIPVLQKLVDDNPNVLPIQSLLVGIFGLSGHYDQCVAMATRTMRSFPDNPSAPAQTAISILGAAGRWEEALAVAKEWHQRSLAQPMLADLAIADAYLNLRKPSDAIAQLTDPYLNEINQGKKSPNDYDQVYVRYLQALLNSGDTNAAVKAITPLLKDRRWRVMWMESMALLSDDKVAAESLNELSKFVPADANDERLSMAIIWNVLFSRARNETYETNAFSILDTLNTSPSTKPFLQDYGKRILASPQGNVPGITLWMHWLLTKNSMDETLKAMQPLLNSTAGRLTWISLAAEISAPNAAAQWLDVVGSALIGSSDNATAVVFQKVQLAQAFNVLADRANTPESLKTYSLKTAATLLEPPAIQGASPAAQTLLGIVYENQENYAAAAVIYRHMLQTNPEEVVALNNLASVLAKMKKPSDGPEALRSISKAIKSQPKIPSFFDTQAAVYALLMKDNQSALQSIQQAITLEPNNPNWRVSRIWILASSGQKAAATAEFNELKKSLVMGELIADSRQKLKDAGLQ